MRAGVVGILLVFGLAAVATESSPQASAPLIRSVSVATHPVRPRRYAGAWKLDLSVTAEGCESRQLGVDVFDAAGERVSYAGTPAFECSLTFDNPRLWSAEEPNLYSLVLTLREGVREIETATFQLCFCEKGVCEAAQGTGRKFVLNGQPVELRGTKWSEASSYDKNDTSDASVERLVQQLKQANCNYVRRADCPQSKHFYELCNKHGIYVMDPSCPDEGLEAKWYTITNWAQDRREIRHVFQPLKVVPSKCDEGVDIFNRYYFRDASAYECYWTVFEDGIAVANGVWNIRDLKPRDRKMFRYPTILRQLRATKRFASIRVQFRLREDEGFYPAGWQIANDQIDFPVPLTKQEPVGDASAKNSAHRLVLSGGPIEITFSKETGEIVSYQHGHFWKTEQLKNPVTLDVAGMPTMLDKAAFSGVDRDEKGVIRFSIEQTYRGDRDAAFQVISSYVFGGDGRLFVSSAVRQTAGAKVEPSRIGWRFALDDDDLEVKWFGEGPFGHDADHTSGAFLGRWRSTSRKILPGDRDRTIEMSAGHLGLRAAKRPFAFTVSSHEEETRVKALQSLKFFGLKETCELDFVLEPR